MFEIAEVEGVLSVVKGAEDKKRAAKILAGMGQLTQQGLEIGRELAAMSEENAVKFISVFPRSARQLLENCLRVGKGELAPELLLKTDRATKALGRLPIVEQRKWATELIPVVLKKDDGFDVLRMDILDMNDDLRRQVMADDRIRDEGAQKAYILEAERKQRLKENKGSTMDVLRRPGKWTIRNGRCYLEPEKIEAGLTKADAMKIYRDLS